MRYTLPTLVAASLLASPVVAQDHYGQIFGGASFLQDPNFEGVVTPPGGIQSVGTDFDTRFSIGGAVGKSLPSLNFGQFRVRGEVELSYNTGDVGSVFFSGNGPAAETNVAGDISTTRLFGNLIADLPTGGAFTPYAGIGLGIASTDTAIVYGNGVTLNDRSENLSAQLILGGAYALSDNLSLTGDMRYVRDFGVDVPRFNGAGGLTGVVSDDVSSVNLNVGLRFGF
ncbi:outer membrane beta-barrel protein [uncultured Litoreibacter sp.]|uniref:outer membrane protein n=1 Tax=uncultured Litoreibacter sp. TaxID=1392394 RepID=UPI00261E275E|nr:outer membrane beta-barrel protein [uncultured Litoreibacter sp.]